MPKTIPSDDDLNAHAWSADDQADDWPDEATQALMDAADDAMAREWDEQLAAGRLQRTARRLQRAQDRAAGRFPVRKVRSRRDRRRHRAVCRARSMEARYPRYLLIDSAGELLAAADQFDQILEHARHLGLWPPTAWARVTRALYRIVMEADWYAGDPWGCSFDAMITMRHGPEDGSDRWCAAVLAVEDYPQTPRLRRRGGRFLVPEERDRAHPPDARPVVDLFAYRA